MTQPLPFRAKNKEKSPRSYVLQEFLRNLVYECHGIGLGYILPNDSLSEVIRLLFLEEGNNDQGQFGMKRVEDKDLPLPVLIMLVTTCSRYRKDALLAIASFMKDQNEAQLQGELAKKPTPQLDGDQLSSCIQSLRGLSGDELVEIIEVSEFFRQSAFKVFLKEGDDHLRSLSENGLRRLQKIHPRKGAKIAVLRQEAIARYEAMDPTERKSLEEAKKFFKS